MCEKRLTPEEKKADIEKYADIYKAFRWELYKLDQFALPQAVYVRRSDISIGRSTLVGDRFNALRYYDVLASEALRISFNMHADINRRALRCKAWSNVIDQAASDKDKISDVMDGFAGFEANYALGLPYAIQQGFFYHFCNIAFQLKVADGRAVMEDAPGDKDIKFDLVKKFAQDDPDAESFFKALRGLYVEKFPNEMRDLRNTFIHRVNAGFDGGGYFRFERRELTTEEARKLLSIRAQIHEGDDFPAFEEPIISEGISFIPPARISKLVDALWVECEQINKACLELNAYIKRKDAWVQSHLEE